jgi:NAD(P)-dependent dehydrogenase (short-subunit alcohol dehydrogenase family)
MAQPFDRTFDFNGKTAVITGAAGGIGRALAFVLAAEGCHLALVDRRAEALAETVSALTNQGLRLSTHELDVSDRAAVAALPAQVQALHGSIHLLVNNAGVALAGTFEMVTKEEFDWLFDINFHAVVALTRAFLPYLRAAPGGAHIVNLSSIFGIIAPAGQVAYSASKFAVRGFSMALAHELEGSGVGVSVVHPGGVATDIARHARLAAALPRDAALDERLKRANEKLTLPPVEAARIILRGVRRRQQRILVGGDARLIAWLERLAPVAHWRWVSRLMGRGES